MRRTVVWLLVCWFGAFSLWLSGFAARVAAAAQPDPIGGTSGDEIRIGMSAALSGPTQSLGQNMQRGIEARFARVNRGGGIAGRKLKLVALDDGYEPGVTRRNMLKLIKQHDVLALLGNVGTPTAQVAVPIANDRRTLLFGALTGAPLLRKSPSDRYVINYRASYAEETEAMVQGLLASGVQPFEIAFFSQADAYGDAGFEGAVLALAREGFPYGRRLVHVRYERNTTDVQDAVVKILDAYITPRAIIMIGAYAPSAKFIRILRRVLPSTLFLNVSFVGSEPLAEALGDIGEGVIVTQVVPHYESPLPLCRQYLSDLDSLFPDAAPGFVSFEGYVVATILAEAIRRGTGPLTRETIIDGIENLGELDVGLGATLQFGPESHQGSHHVWPTVLRGARYEPLNWGQLKKVVEP